MSAGALTIDICPSIQSIDVQEFEPLTRDRSFYVSWPWLKAVEWARGGAVEYLCARDAGGRLIGVLPRYREAPGAYHLLDHVLRPSGGRFRATDWSPAAVVGTQAGYDTEFTLAPDLPPAVRTSVLTELLTAAGPGPVPALHLNPRGQAQLTEAGLELFPVSGACVIDVEAPSFEAFTTGLGRRGNKMRRERRDFAAAGYELVTGRLSEFVTTAAELCTQLQRKYGDEGSAADRERYMSVLAAAADQHSHVTVLRRDGHDVGIVISFVWGDTLYVRQAGFDYDRTGSAFEYFNLVIYQSVELAIARSLRHVDLGLSSYRAKLARGARVEPRAGFARSAAGTGPGADPGFAGWEQRRREVLERGDAAELDALA